MPARAAMPIIALALLFIGIACRRPPKVVGTTTWALGVTATALSMGGSVACVSGAKGHRVCSHYSERSVRGWAEQAAFAAPVRATVRSSPAYDARHGSET